MVMRLFTWFLDPFIISHRNLAIKFKDKMDKEAFFKDSKDKDLAS